MQSVQKAFPKLNFRPPQWVQNPSTAFNFYHLSLPWNKSRPSQVYCNSVGFFIAVVKTPLAFIFFLTFLHSLTSEPQQNAEARGRVCFPSWCYQIRLLLSPPADIRTSANEAPEPARRTTLGGQDHREENETVRPPPAYTAWGLPAELLCLHRSRRKMTTTLISYFLLCSLKFWLPAVTL